jgi:polyisoprenoid-binding protein YceI
MSVRRSIAPAILPLAQKFDSVYVMKAPIFVILWLYFGFTVGAAEKAPPSAQEVIIDLDPSKSTVQFTLGAVMHTVHGTFKVKSGTVRWEIATGKTSGQIVVDVKSGYTGVGARDRQMHEAVLESDRFPEAIFSPDRVTGQVSTQGESQVDVRGILRIHGDDHEVTFHGKVNLQDRRITGTAKFVMPYKNWGMKDPSTFVLRVNDKVELEMTLTGTIR